MSPFSVTMLKKLNYHFSLFFPKRVCENLWNQIEQRQYERKIKACCVIQSTLIAFVCRLSGLRDITSRCNHLLLTKNFDSISKSFLRISFLSYVKKMVEFITSTYRPRSGDLVAIDSMPLTLPKTQRHNCKTYNSKTVGGGVLWEYMINKTGKRSPVKILEIVQGAWHDSKIIRSVKLISRGPVYLMDRGFYALDLLNQWVEQKVHFIVRVKKSCLKYEPIKDLCPPVKIGKQIIHCDCIVRLGGPQAKAHPQLRLLWVILPNNEDLILATDLFYWTPYKILESYKKRHHIERFHRYLKDSLGLAHLYSFDQRGIEFLIYCAVLMALLLVMTDNTKTMETIKVLIQQLKEMRRSLGLGTKWKRNIATKHRSKSTILEITV